MIKRVTTRQELKQFIYFKEDLYSGTDHFVPPLYYVLYKELKREVLETNTYIALLDIEDGHIKGRVLYTVDDNKMKNGQVGYFSYFDFTDDIAVSRRLLNAMVLDLETKGITYLEGAFTPYDPDTRRGVLVKGFDDDPSIFASYHLPYYKEHFAQLGFEKVIDTVALNVDVNSQQEKKLRVLSKYFSRHNDVRVDYLNFKEMQRDVKDIHQILMAADHDSIYQETPTIDMIESVAGQLRLFVDPKLVLIARENDTNKPIGFCFALPDYHQVFKKLKGRIRPIRFLFAKRKINRARGFMQYVIPEYQGSGLIGKMYYQMFEVFKTMKITKFTAGTMVEDNRKPIDLIKKFGGEITQVYRIYGKDITL